MAEKSKGGMAYDKVIGWPDIELVIGTTKDGTNLLGDALETAPDGYGTVTAAYNLQGENALADARKICAAWNSELLRDVLADALEENEESRP